MAELRIIDARDLLARPEIDIPPGTIIRVMPPYTLEFEDTEKATEPQSELSSYQECHPS